MIWRCPHCQEMQWEINRLKAELADARRRSSEATALAVRGVETRDRMMLELICSGALSNGARDGGR